MHKIVEKNILPKYFDAVIHDKKKFEICKDEDDLRIGDAVILKEWNGEKYTGREVGRNNTEYQKVIQTYKDAISDIGGK